MEPEQTTPPEGDGQTTPPVSGDDPSKNYEARFKGLQSTYQQLQASTTKTITALTQERDALTSQVTTLQSTIQAKDGELATTNGKISTLTTELESEKQNSGKHMKESTRLKLILKKFPDLAMFEDAGLLPSADTPEELETKLTAFKTATTSLVGKGVQDRMAGSPPPVTTPTTPTGDPTESEDYIWDQMTKFAGKDPAKFGEWQAKWDTLQASKNTKK
jgi:hypothetical protein